MTKDEALDLALEALENLFGIPDKWTGEGGGDVAVWRLGGSYRAQQAITAIKQALAAPVQEPAGGTQVSKVWWDGEKLMAKPIPLVDFYQPVQDSTCSETLRAQGKAYPRTCRKCGLGPCIGAPKQPPAQPAPAPGYCKHCKQYSIEEPLPAAQQDIQRLSALVRAQQITIDKLEAKRQWVGLTDDELSEVYNQANWDTVNGWEYERAIEAKLKEKNT